MSEPESRMLLDLVRRYPIRTALNVHSGEHSTYDPYDAPYGVPLPHRDEYATKLARVVRHHMCPECEREGHIGSASTHSAYAAYCTVSDYLVFHRLARYAFTLEVYGRFDTRDVFALFNPTTKAGYDHVIREWAAEGGIVDALLQD